MNKDRLLQLSEHLLNGELGHKFFDLAVYNVGVTKDFETGRAINSCGTTGCALGECPIIWPKEWVFSEHSYIPRLVNSPFAVEAVDPTITDAMKFFDIDRKTAKWLFTPTYSPSITDTRLPPDATKEQVANRIIDFVNSD